MLVVSIPPLPRCFLFSNERAVPSEPLNIRTGGVEGGGVVIARETILVKLMYRL